MATHVWSVICQRVIIDRESNAVSYIDVIEGFRAAEFPVSLPPMSVSTLWLRDEPSEALDVRIRVIGPSKKPVFSFEPSEPIKLTKKRHRLNIILGGIEAEEPGEYRIHVERKSNGRWKKEAIVPIDLTLAAVDSE